MHLYFGLRTVQSQMPLQAQEPLGPVELPSDVMPLPADYLAWLFFAAGIYLLLHLYAKWLMQRKPKSATPDPEPVVAPSTLLEDLQSLRHALSDLSSTQRKEALTLSLLLRRTSGEYWSATDEELLRIVDPASRDAFANLLHFTTRILFARCPATREQWMAACNQAESLVLQHLEEST